MRSTRLRMLVQDLKELYHYLASKKILWVSEVEKLPQIRAFHHLFSPLRWVQMDIETKNLGRAHVCRDKR